MIIMSKDRKAIMIKIKSIQVVKTQGRQVYTDS